MYNFLAEQGFSKNKLIDKFKLKVESIFDILSGSSKDSLPKITNSTGQTPKDKKKWPELFDKWPRHSLIEKKRIALEKRKTEGKALDKLIQGLPNKIKKDIKNSWLEYDKNSTKEARFVKQVNRLEALLQALEYGKEEKIRVYKSWWVGSREKIDDPVLIRFMNSLAKEFSIKTPKK